MTAGDRQPPRWLKLANRFVVAMLARGMGAGTQRLLTVAGRKSGLPRTTPISTVSYEGSRYIVAGYQTSDWVGNARAAGVGTLHKGAGAERVGLVEVPVADRLPILREFLRTVRGGRSFITVGPKATDAELAEAAQVHPVFRLDPLP